MALRCGLVIARLHDAVTMVSKVIVGDCIHARDADFGLMRSRAIYMFEQWESTTRPAHYCT